MATPDQVTERYGEVVFDHAHDEEERRLDGLARAFDPITRARIGALGIEPGWRCLEVGAGSGTIAHWLAGQVAPAPVIAVDRGTTLIPSAPNLRCLEVDALADDLPGSLAPGSFDLVHSRFLLEHLPERERLLERMVSWLAPGGWLVAGDFIDLTGTSPSPLYRDLFAGAWEAIRATIGTDVTWVRDYSRLMSGLGLAETGMEAHLPEVRLGAPINDFWRFSLTTLRERILATGLIEEPAYDEAMALFDDPGFSDLSPGLVTAWGRRPESAPERGHGTVGDIPLTSYR